MSNGWQVCHGGDRLEIAVTGLDPTDSSSNLAH